MKLYDLKLTGPEVKFLDQLMSTPGVAVQRQGWKTASSAAEKFEAASAMVKADEESAKASA